MYFLFRLSQKNILTKNDNDNNNNRINVLINMFIPFWDSMVYFKSAYEVGIYTFWIKNIDSYNMLPQEQITENEQGLRCVHLIRLRFIW